MRLLSASIMDTDSKISLKIAVIESYKHNSKKSNEYAHKNFKNWGVHKARIQKIKIKQNGINQNTVIEVFESFQERVFKANESGIDSLLNI